MEVCVTMRYFSLTDWLVFSCFLLLAYGKTINHIFESNAGQGTASVTRGKTFSLLIHWLATNAVAPCLTSLFMLNPRLGRMEIYSSRWPLKWCSLSENVSHPSICLTNWSQVYVLNWLCSSKYKHIKTYTWKLHNEQKCEVKEGCTSSRRKRYN